ncbi:MAG: (Fe-S)-binding protein [Chlorobiaceae bacterium]|nr:(Fe-S)-binding protein [Chlorobiaceae bacterium]
MNATREIFWNIGQEMVVLMYLLALLSVVGLVQGFRQRLAIWRKGKSLDRFDHPAERFSSFIADALSQRKVSRDGEGGLAHAILFWSFLLLFVGTLLVMVQIDLLAPLFHVNLLKGSFYLFFSLFLDLAGLLAMLALVLLAARRYIIRPPSLESRPADAILHLLLFAILLTGFMTEGCRMAVTEMRDNPMLALWSPGGYFFAQLFTSLGERQVKVAHTFLWWGHLLLGLGCIAVVPRTKLRHLVTTGGNSFFEPHEPKGSLPPVDLEDYTQERFGLTLTGDLSWKDIYDADACTRCGRCQERCPAYLTGKPLSPQKVISQIGELAESSQERGLIDVVTRDALWACTTCGACEEICPAGIEHVSKIVGMRRSLVLMSGEFPGEEARIGCEGIEINGNPFGLSGSRRGDWAQGLPVSLDDGKKEIDILYFTGCFASFDPRHRKVAESFVRICSAAGIRVGILGNAERCCGEPARKLGNEYLYRMMAESNIAAFRASGALRLVTACPHCFNTLVRDYRELGFEVPVEHHSTFIAGLIAKGRLRLKPEFFSATFHDSCYLARYRDIVEEPRFVLGAAGVKVLEMARYGSEGFCCGGGGGRILVEERLGRQIADVRTEMARATGTSTLVTACPFCLTMLEESFSRNAAESGSPGVYDLAEIVAAVIDRQ